MPKWEMFKESLKKRASNDADYKDCIKDLLTNQEVRGLHNFVQHGNVSRLEHSLFVSYKSFLLCKKLGLDYCSAARGGLLHDFFLYNRKVEKPYKGIHGFAHPKIALDNASKYFNLNEIEKDIIKKHMWPLTIVPPKYMETLVVSCVDKYCATLEFANMGGKKNLIYLKKLAQI
ncbi:MAG: HD family phosphohydrolase [Zhaonellaceae bacterium]|jgi:uncharacterized protein|nr:HD family phosphohydrolase [Clostridia bacterium]